MSPESVCVLLFCNSQFSWDPVPVCVCLQYLNQVFIFQKPANQLYTLHCLPELALGRPRITPRLCLCGSVCVLTGRELYIVWICKSVQIISLSQPIGSVISNLYTCWALTDQLTVSLFISLVFQSLVQKVIKKIHTGFTWLDVTLHIQWFILHFLPKEIHESNLLYFIKKKQSLICHKCCNHNDCSY